MTPIQANIATAMMMPAAVAATAMARTTEMMAAQAEGWSRLLATDAPHDAAALPAPKSFDPAKAELPGIDGALTAADGLADAPDYSADTKQDVARLVDETTGMEPRGLGEMLPATGVPARKLS